PVFEDEERTRGAALLHFILITGFSIDLLATIGSSLTTGINLQAMGTTIVALLVQALVFVLMREGRVDLTALILIGTGGSILAYESYTSTGVLNPIFGAQTLTIIISGLLIGGWAAIVFAVLSSALGFWLLQAANAGRYPLVVGDVTAQQAWVNNTWIFLLA